MAFYGKKISTSDSRQTCCRRFYMFCLDVLDFLHVNGQHDRMHAHRDL